MSIRRSGYESNATVSSGFPISPDVDHGCAAPSHVIRLVSFQDPNAKIHTRSVSERGRDVKQTNKQRQQTSFS